MNTEQGKSIPERGFVQHGLACITTTGPKMLGAGLLDTGGTILDIQRTTKASMTSDGQRNACQATGMADGKAKSECRNWCEMLGGPPNPGKNRRCDSTVAGGPSPLFSTPVFHLVG